MSSGVDEGKFVSPSGLTRPALNGVEVTPTDGVDLTHPEKMGATRGLWVGGAGDIAVIFESNDEPVNIVAVPSGILLPFRVKRVNSTNTTATSIVALY